MAHASGVFRRSALPAGDEPAISDTPSPVSWNRTHMRIATWNVNSINARLETVTAWFEEAQPDVACLQEIKCVDEKFPTEAFERLGYNVAVHGQKTYNGVAMLSKTPLEDVRKGLIGKIGENMTFRRFKRFASDAKLATYLHGTRIGVVVEFDGDEVAADAVATTGPPVHSADHTQVSTSFSDEAT